MTIQELIDLLSNFAAQSSDGMDTPVLVSTEDDSYDITESQLIDNGDDVVYVDLIVTPDE